MKLRYHLARDGERNLCKFRLQRLKIIPAYKVVRKMFSEKTHHVFSTSFNAETAHNASDADVNRYKYGFRIIAFKLDVVDPDDPGAVFVNVLFVKVVLAHNKVFSPE